MIRTQVYLPEELHQEITITAAQRDIPAAQLVRDLLKQGLMARKKTSVAEALLQLTQVHGKGPKDLSTNLDDYLYGDKQWNLLLLQIQVD